MTQDVQERDTEWLLLRLVPKQAVCRFLIKRRRLSCRLSCFRETLCSLQNTWQTRELATRGSSRAPPYHLDTPALGDWTVQAAGILRALLHARCNRVLPCTTAPHRTAARTATTQRANKQQTKATSHLWRIVSLWLPFYLSISKSAKQWGTAPTAEQTILGKWSGAMARDIQATHGGVLGYETGNPVL